MHCLLPHRLRAYTLGLSLDQDEVGVVVRTVPDDPEFGELELYVD